MCFVYKSQHTHTPHTQQYNCYSLNLSGRYIAIIIQYNIQTYMKHDIIWYSYISNIHFWSHSALTTTSRNAGTDTLWYKTNFRWMFNSANPTTVLQTHL
jgi:predicted KAP-like P-loop ATPase